MNKKPKQFEEIYFFYWKSSYSIQFTAKRPDIRVIH